MAIITAWRSTARAKSAGKPKPDLSGIRPLPVWFFAFEGIAGAAYDICRVWADAWMVLAALGLINMAVGLTVLGRRRKLVKAMLKNSRTRAIAVALLALRFGVHLALAAVGGQITSAAGHLTLAVGMAATTVGLLWFDQHVTFRALGLTGTRTASVAGLEAS